MSWLDPRKTDDPSESFGHGLLIALQLIALGMCVLIIYEMALQDALRIPHQECIDAPITGMPSAEAQSLHR